MSFVFRDQKSIRQCKNIVTVKKEDEAFEVGVNEDVSVYLNGKKIETSAEAPSKELLNELIVHISHSLPDQPLRTVHFQIEEFYQMFDNIDVLERDIKAFLNKPSDARVQQISLSPYPLKLIATIDNFKYSTHIVPEKVVKSIILLLKQRRSEWIKHFQSPKFTD
jgi:hypothetical protein